MRKRLEDQDKWIQDIWFKNLPPKQKLFWIYLNDICDNVGVFDMDIDLASHLIKDEYNEEDVLVPFKDKIRDIGNGKW